MNEQVKLEWLSYGNVKYLATDASEETNSEGKRLLVFHDDACDTNNQCHVQLNDTTEIYTDPVGLASVYFTHWNGCWYIARKLSALKGLHEQFQLSKQALYHYFFFHCIPAPHCIYENVYKTSAGAKTRLFDEGKWDSELHYRPTFNEQPLANVKSSQQDCLKLIEQCVGNAIKANSGAFLSGGLDSSTVAGMMAKHQPSPKTFSIGFTSKEHDETEYAQITAKHFNLAHQVKILQPEEAISVFKQVAQSFDEPFGNSSAMATYFCAKFAKEHGVDHLLAGDGGDEIFAGNERYAKQKVFNLFTKQPKLIRALLDFSFNNELCAKLPLLKKATSYIRQAKTPMPDRLENYNFIHQFGAENIFTEEFLQAVDKDLPISMRRERYNACLSSDQVDKQLFLDWKFTLADNDIVKVKTMCQLAGISVSFPLLDQRLVDYSCTIPAETKLPKSSLRDFFKNMCRGFLADATLEKSKHGFGLPFGVWLKENKVMGDIAMNALEQLKARKIVKASLIEQAQSAHRQIHANYYGELIWIMVVLELWLQGCEEH